MILIECPLCDATIRLDDERSSSSCEACGVILELAPDAAPAPALAQAA